MAYTLQQIGLWVRSTDEADKAKAKTAIEGALCSCGATSKPDAAKPTSDAWDKCCKGDKNRAAAKLNVGERTLARWVLALKIDVAGIKANHGMPPRGGYREAGSALRQS